jgi:hypothetical protein
MTVKGKLMAAAVAGLFSAAMPLLAHAGAPANDAKVKCDGGNACKGKGGCKSAHNDCAGHNGCKGQSFTMTKTEKECTDAGGTVAKADDKKPAPPAPK